MTTAKTGQNIDIVQVSDTHLSESHAWFTANWPVFVHAMRNDPPELVINSGDLSFNGQANPDDLAFAARCHAALQVPWRAIAGNHDTGEAPAASRLDQPISDARLAAWRQHVGPSWRTQDLDRETARLRLIGLETALMGSDHADEAAQVAFFEDALNSRDGRAVMVFVHMPPFRHDPDDPAIATHCILPEPQPLAAGPLHDGRSVGHRSGPYSSSHLHPPSRHADRDGARHLVRQCRAVGAAGSDRIKNRVFALGL